MNGFLPASDILSVFARVNALPLLCELLGCDRLPITTGVFNEILIRSCAGRAADARSCARRSGMRIRALV